MKKAIFAFIAILSAATIVVSSCSKNVLEEVVYSSLTSDLAFTSGENAEAAVVAMYAPMRKIYYRYMNDVNDTSTDLNNGKMSISDRLNDAQLFTDSYNSLLYAEWCKIATRANIVLDELPKMDEILFANVDSREVMMAQAHFMRAYAYYNLSDIYYQVPLVLSSYVDVAEKQMYASIEDIDDAIEADLLEAVKDLPRSWDEANIQKATYGAAEALLTELYMRKAGRMRLDGEDASAVWQKALTECNKILAMVGSEYELLPDVRDAFSPSTTPNTAWSSVGVNNKELIWAQRNNGESSDGSSNLGLMFTDWSCNLGWGCIRGSLELAWMFDKTDHRYTDLLAYQFSEIYGTGGNPGFHMAPEKVEDSGNVSNLAKLRTDLFTDPIQGQDITPDMWAGLNVGELEHLGSYKYPNTDLWVYSYINPNNFPIFRVAEFYLAKAEILNELNGPTQDAVDAINKIRERAFGNTEHNFSLASVGSRDEFRSLICDERAMELNNEAKRRPDLIRMGLWKDRLDKYIESKKTIAYWVSTNNPSITYEQALGTYKTYPKDLVENDIRRYWPIPFREVELSPELANARTF